MIFAKEKAKKYGNFSKKLLQLSLFSDIIIYRKNCIFESGRCPLSIVYNKVGGIMAKNIGIAALAEKAIEPLVHEMGYRLWDVEYVREGAEQYLRVTLDGDNGINIEDCEKVHRAILPILESYEWDHLEVSSPGAERTLKKPEHYASVYGEKAEIRLYAPDENGKKAYVGKIISSDENGVTLETANGEITVLYEKIGKAQTLYDFEKI